MTTRTLTGLVCFSIAVTQHYPRAARGRGEFQLTAYRMQSVITGEPGPLGYCVLVLVLGAMQALVLFSTLASYSSPLVSASHPGLELPA